MIKYSFSQESISENSTLQILYLSGVPRSICHGFVFIPESFLERWSLGAQGFSRLHSIVSHPQTHSSNVILFFSHQEVESRPFLAFVFAMATHLQPKREQYQDIV